jgi:precorrin-6Y C5,15-methyltransferase (decarboxylating)
VELARKAFDGFVYAIEHKEDACALVRENATKHGAFNLEVIHGEAPYALDDLPIPDKAFIGGSSGKMDGILDKLLTLNPNIRIVINAITLQTMTQAIEWFERHGAETDITCVNIAKSRKTGGYDIMTAQNPIYIVRG